jgi:hypothetical protein
MEARLILLEIELQQERTQRLRAEHMLSEVEKECRVPFVVPALFQAFCRISELGHHEQSKASALYDQDTCLTRWQSDEFFLAHVHIQGHRPSSGSVFPNQPSKPFLRHFQITIFSGW